MKPQKQKISHKDFSLSYILISKTKCKNEKKCSVAQ